MVLVLDREVRKWAYATPWFGMGIEYLDQHSIDVRRQMTDPRGYVYKGSMIYAGSRIQTWLNPPGTLTRTAAHFGALKDITIGRNTNSLLDVMGRQNVSRMGKFLGRTSFGSFVLYVQYNLVEPIIQEGLERVGEALASSASEMFSGYQSHRR